MAASSLRLRVLPMDRSTARMMSFYRAPKPGTSFRLHRGRLALFHRGDRAADYWRSYWTPARRKALVAGGAAGDLGELGPLIETWVAREQLTLEAGCGPGHFVAALQARGYRVFGIELEPDVVRFVNTEVPSLDVRVGDITHLDLPDASLGAYLSFGVVEHFEGGPETALAEARRVIQPRGIALISVPFLNGGRARMLASLRHRGEEHDYKFHQYYFNIEDFSAVLRNCGFEPLLSFPYAVNAYLTREHPVLSRLWNTRLAGDWAKRRLRRAFEDASSEIRRRYGHMIMFVCRRR